MIEWIVVAVIFLVGAPIALAAGRICRQLEALNRNLDMASYQKRMGDQ